MRISLSVNVVFESDAGTLVSKGNDMNISKVISINENISAPICKGDTIGSVTFSLNDDIISNVNLVADRDVNKVNILTMSKYIYKNWFCLLR